MEDQLKLEKATFAGGCFWCLQGPFDNTDGVVSTRVGYMGGTKSNPTYEEVSSGTTGHAESIEVVFDPKKVSYRELLDIFWRNIDPTSADGQFADRGSQYRTVIFCRDERQRRTAEESKAELESSGVFDKPVVTRIEPASEFYPAEDYHQEYYKKHPFRYRFYKEGSGRGPFLRDKWGEPEDSASA